MKHQQTWGQCEEQISRYRENGCCTVIALANTMDWSFGKAHRYMKKFGRRDRCGMLTRDIIKALANIGKTISSVLVRGHALAVVDGTVQDWTGDTAQRRKLQGYFDMRA